VCERDMVVADIFVLRCTQARVCVCEREYVCVSGRENVYVWERSCVCERDMIVADIFALRCTHDMGRLRLVGSIKLYVSFAECSLFHRALLQFAKETYKFIDPTNRSHPIGQGDLVATLFLIICLFCRM